MLKSAENSADFFKCGFLATLWLSGVHLYAYETQIAPSASK